MIAIRKATKDDINQVVRLLEQLWYKQSIDDLQEMFDLYTNSDDYNLIVAEKDAGVVGLVAYSLTKIFVTGNTRIHIEAFVVDSAFRRIGIGKLLASYIENTAVKYAPCVIDLVSRASRAKYGAHDFYKSIGYEYSGDSAKIYFRKEIRNI